MRRRQICRRHSQCFSGQLRAVELRCVPQHGFEAVRAYIGTNPLYDLRRRERFAENLDRLPTPRFANDIAAWRQLCAQGCYSRLGTRFPRINLLDS